MKNQMLFAANEKGSILLDIAIFFGLLAILALAGIKFLSPILHKIDTSSCGVMENCG